jgi:cobyrinic acid a,c-diamide synthase
MTAFSSFLIAAPHSGAGKTTLTLGLLRALTGRGLRAQPFKCGPDYIDTMHHGTAAGRPSINLDQYMMSSGHIGELYRRYTADADVAVAEGVMGLFDGAPKRAGSSADLALLLGLPVVLVLNAKAMAYSAGALLYGLKNFDASLRVAGVVFNFVDSERHYQLLREACDDVGVAALGHLPTNAALHIPSRHLGLDTADAEAAIAAAAEHIGRHLDLDALLAATARERSCDLVELHAVTASERPSDVVELHAATASERPLLAGTEVADGEPAGKCRVLVARDAAFQFRYAENLRRLESLGELRFFSPLNDARLPVADVLYLPGGYPELYLQQLANNITLLEDIRRFVGRGGRILAECGGMMVLGKAIVDEACRSWPMAGVLPITTSMQEKKLHLGYRTLTMEGQTLKGHEFHYSQFLDAPDPDNGIVVHNAYGQQVPAPVFYRQNLFASYMHFYWGENLGPLQRLLAGG